jgi:hypothetical protein
MFIGRYERSRLDTFGPWRLAPTGSNRTYVCNGHPMGSLYDEFGWGGLSFDANR